MANFIQNAGKWGPIEEGTNDGGFPIRSYDGRQIVLDFDDTEVTSIMYTRPVGLPLPYTAELIWNTEAVDCDTDTDMEVFWQGTEDPSVANLTHGGSDVSASDTGWITVSVQNFAGSNAADTRTVTRLGSVSNVERMPYMRFKYVLTAANPGDVNITCRLVNPAPYSGINYGLVI